MVAPKATIDLVVSEDTQTAFGIDLSALYIIDNQYRPGDEREFWQLRSRLRTTGNQFYNSLWEQRRSTRDHRHDPLQAIRFRGVRQFQYGHCSQARLAVSGFAYPLHSTSPSAERISTTWEHNPPFGVRQTELVENPPWDISTK